MSDGTSEFGSMGWKSAPTCTTAILSMLQGERILSANLRIYSRSAAIANSKGAALARLPACRLHPFEAIRGKLESLTICFELTTGLNYLLR